MNIITLKWPMKVASLPYLEPINTLYTLNYKLYTMCLKQYNLHCRLYTLPCKAIFYTVQTVLHYFGFQGH